MLSADQNIGPSDPSMAAAAVNQRGKESRMSTVRRTRTELKRTTSVQLSRGSGEAEIGARPGLEGEVAHLEVELEAVEERVSRLMNLIEEKMPLYKQVVGIFYGDGLLFLACLVAITVAPHTHPQLQTARSQVCVRRAKPWEVQSQRASASTPREVLCSME